MEEPIVPLPQQTSPTELPKEALPTSLPSDATAVSLPIEHTCVLGPNDRAEILRDGGFKLNGVRILSDTEMKNCKWTPGFSLFFEYVEPPKQHSKKHKAVKEIVSLPLDATPTSIGMLADDSTQTSTDEASVAFSPNIDNKNINGMDPVVIAAIAAAAVATTIAAVSITNSKTSSKAKAHKNKIKSKTSSLKQQQKKREEEQKKCHGNSERVQGTIDDTSNELNFVEPKVNEFYNRKDEPIFEKEIEELNSEIKKVKKIIKELDK